ncbi:uncharacterized protein K441DRAFT_709141 [Cenococcum geophilum 1.58]|uniref:Uncharacterized protein n=1 Tax=Cenococcum geophilum 1.58 TaxID=794803 RepID=A0ACC8ENX0_9PEZI|nr:hypothetical protein K441DRAFT_709141 [Cenococcum geophilum 1.58]
MAGLLKWGKSILQRAPSPPLRFLTTGFKVFAPSEILDKERFEEFKLGRYYLVNIGEVFDSKYQVIGKLGFGVTSTVYTRDEDNKEEFEIYKQLSKGDSSYPGYHPLPRKFVNDAPIYASRRFELPKKFGAAVLSDFGSAHLFHGYNLGYKQYATHTHLSKVIGLLGPPPLNLIKRGTQSPEFFTEDGQWKADVGIPKDTSLEKSEEYLKGKNKEIFIKFMRKMLQWRLEDRQTAKQLLKDPWLND